MSQSRGAKSVNGGVTFANLLKPNRSIRPTGWDDPSDNLLDLNADGNFASSSTKNGVTFLSEEYALNTAALLDDIVSMDPKKLARLQQPIEPERGDNQVRLFDVSTTG